MRPIELMVWHYSLPLVNIFNKREAAIFSMQAMLPESFPRENFPRNRSMVLLRANVTLTFDLMP